MVGKSFWQERKKKKNPSIRIRRRGGCSMRVAFWVFPNRFWRETEFQKTHTNDPLGAYNIHIIITVRRRTCLRTYTLQQLFRSRRIHNNIILQSSPSFESSTRSPSRSAYPAGRGACVVPPPPVADLFPSSSSQYEQ